MMRTIGLLLSILFLFLSVLSCISDTEKDKISPSKMEEILYDYYLAENLSQRAIDDLPHSSEYAYRMSVLKKHGVSKAEFDSSMVYYYRHTNELQLIYKNISERVNREAVHVGLIVEHKSGINSYANNKDTAQVWKHSTAVMLSMAEPFNIYSFTLDADTSYHQGDEMILTFDTHFIYQDGSRDGVALLAVKFKNDSVAMQTIRMTSSSYFRVAIRDNEQHGIKQVKGYFLLNKDQANSAIPSTTLRLMSVYNISLLKVHHRSEPLLKETVGDTLHTDVAFKDSLRVTRGISP